MKRFSFLICVLLSTMCVRAGDQWSESRGDRAQSGRSTLKGDIRKPKIVWKHQLAARQTLWAATLAEGAAAQVPLPTENISSSAQPRDRLLAEWGAAPPWHDLDGNGQLISSESWIGTNTKLGKILPNVPGMQLVVAEPLNDPDRQPDRGTVRLKVRDNGRWVEKWKATTDTLIWVAEPIFGDFDRDGRTEIAVLPLYKLNILDAQTGRVKEQAHFKTEDEAPLLGGRAYGWFGAVDLDGRERDEFLIVDDFTHHIAVLGWRGGKLQRLWNWILHDKVYHPTPQNTVALVVNPQPVRDVDGDGDREIVVSIYNHARDLRWHTLLIDGMTGKVLLDLSGWFFAGASDLDADGAAELFCVETTTGLRRPDPSRLAIFSMKGDEPSIIWQLDNAAFQMHDLADFPGHVNSGASTPRRTVLCQAVSEDARPIFFTRREGELIVWQMTADGQIAQVARASGPRLEALAIPQTGDGKGAVLLRCSTLAGEGDLALKASNLSISALQSQLIPAPMSPVVVAKLEPGAPPTMIVQGANETIEAIRARADGAVERLWRVPGRAMTCFDYYEGALAADLNGDRTLSVVIGARGEGDCARVVVLDARGKERWRRDFPDFPGNPPPWNVPGLIYWQAGYFRDEKRMDLLVQLRRIGGETYLLDGRTGETIWTRDHCTEGREFGRRQFAIFDYDGNGREDVLTNFPDVFCAADGATGGLLLKKYARDLAPGEGYYGGTIAHDFLGDGSLQMLFCNANAITMLKRDASGEVSRVWATRYDASDPQHPLYGSDVRPALADADGDGRLEIYVPGYKQRASGQREFHCLDAATGQLRWRLPLPNIPTSPAAADIDGDGREECVFTIDTTVYAVGTSADGRSGRIEWTLPMPNYMSTVAIADVLGDRKAQIVVSCQDGYVYGIGAAE